LREKQRFLEKKQESFEKTRVLLEKEVVVSREHAS